MFDWFLNIPLDFRDLRATADGIELTNQKLLEIIANVCHEKTYKIPV